MSAPAMTFERRLYDGDAFTVLEPSRRWGDNGLGGWPCLSAAQQRLAAVDYVRRVPGGFEYPAIHPATDPHCPIWCRIVLEGPQ